MGGIPVLAPSAQSQMQMPFRSTPIQAVGQPNAAAAAPGLADPLSANAKEFFIVVDKKGESKLGIAVNYHSGKGILIDGISDGVLQNWNKENPEQALRMGDRIVEVNSVCGDGVQLVEECKKSQILMIKVLRYE